MTLETHKGDRVYTSAQVRALKISTPDAGKLRGGGASFWHLVPLPGRESVLAAMKTARSVRDITDNIAWAELDADLFALLQQPEALDALGQTLASHW